MINDEFNPIDSIPFCIVEVSIEIKIFISLFCEIINRVKRKKKNEKEKSLGLTQFLVAFTIHRNDNFFNYVALNLIDNFHIIFLSIVLFGVKSELKSTLK